VVSAVPKGFDVHGPFARRSLRRRIVALAAAYVIALGGLFASVAAAGAAAAAVTGSGTVTCHSETTGDPSPIQNHKSGSVCIDCCCVGCVMLMAALPPPVKANGAPQSAARPLAWPSVAAAPATTSSRSHQSRAPPQTA
jgi:hypothetical protein